MDYTEEFEFDYDDHDFIESQELLNDLVEGGVMPGDIVDQVRSHLQSFRNNQ